MQAEATGAAPATYRGEWTLFADWCQALGHSALPATPIIVADFLMHENPDASKAVLRRRVAAINHVHRTAGHPEPGTVTAVRRLLWSRRRDSALARSRIRELPTVGWPAGLFGRRDALILWLAVLIGIPGSALGDLRCADLTCDGRTVVIGGGHDVHIAVDPDDPFGLLPVWRRWAQLRDRLAVRPGPAVLVKPLTAATPVTAGARPAVTSAPPAPRPGYALLPSFDRWGNLIAAPGHDEAGMTGQAVADVITTHLYGAGRGDLSRTTWVDRILERGRPAPPEPETADVVPDPLPDHHGAGAIARKEALAELEDIDETFADIDRRTADILARTEALLSEFGDTA